MNSKGLRQSLGKEKESCCLLLPSSTKREIRQFHVVVVQRRQRNVQKSVMHVQSCCFACLFCRSRCRRGRCVNSLLFRWLTTSALAMFTLYQIPFRADVKSYSRYIIRHFEVARKTGSRWLSKCIVGLFWATHFQHGGKFVPQNSPTMHHLDPISRPISKWRTNGDGTELERVVHTHRTSKGSGCPKGLVH